MISFKLRAAPPAAYPAVQGMKLSYQMAFAQVTKAISKGEFSKEDFKNLLEVYEDGTEKTKG